MAGSSSEASKASPWWCECMERAKNPELVWNFQERFGVQKVRVFRGNDAVDASFVAIDHDDWTQKQADRRKRKERRNLSSVADRSEDEGVMSPVSSSGYSSSADNDEENRNIVFYRIGNWFWYYLFFLGSQLGDETYYSIFFSFWFWNIDGAVGRRVILVWNLVMYIGQGMKDVIRWPRPKMPPVVQLETKWALEYGMPSTHAMVGLAIPASIMFFTMGRYQYPFALWASLALVWTTLVCTSRLYLGMHSFADIYVGLACSCLLLVFVLPLADLTDSLLLSHSLAPLFTVTLSILAVIFYPGSDRWTPARGDTTVVLGSYLGIQLGFWANFQLGIVRGPPLPPPYPILWPTFEQYGHTLMRMIVGGVIIIATRAVFKPLTYFTACYLLNESTTRMAEQKDNILNKKKICAELTYKFLTYVAVGFNVMCIVPIVFKAIGIERSTFYTEV